MKLPAGLLDARLGARLPPDSLELNGAPRRED